MKRFILLYYLLTFLHFVVNAQCDFTVSGIGTFDGTEYNNWVKMTDANSVTYGIFSQEATIVHNGTHSLKVDVIQDHPWGMRMFQTCDYALSNGTFYTVNFWMYGGEGQTVKVALQQNDVGYTVISETSINLTGNDWKEYTAIFLCDGDYIKGKFKFTFPNTGVYYLDDVTVTESSSEGTITITPDNSLLRYTGVASSTITSSRATFFRLPEAYATVDVPGYYTAKRASNSSGITIEFKTSSPFINVYLEENLVYNTTSTYQRDKAVFKDGKLFTQATQDEFTISNPSGEMAVWIITMPAYAQMDFLKLEIDASHPLQTLPADDKPVYVSIGNSITNGLGTTGYSTHLTYSFLVADSMNYHLYNWGIGGSKIYDGILQNFTTAGITPDVITIMWGYNDVHYPSSWPQDTYIDRESFPQYHTILSTLCANFPDAKIIAVLNPYTSNPINDMTGRTVQEMRDAQESILTDLKGSYSNLYSFNGEDYTDVNSLADVVHLNDLGNQQIANAIIGVLDTIFSGTSSTNWYVSNDLGSDNLNGSNGTSPSMPLKSIGYAIKSAWQPGDTIFIMNGTYQNEGYGSGDNNPAVVQFSNSDVNSSESAWLVITNYPGHTPKIQFDGKGGFIINSASYIDISGLEIEGPNQSITKTDALANRLHKDNKFSGRGITVWGSNPFPHHIRLHHLKVHNCPNSGIRINNGDYCEISHNEVYNCTWWSSDAESAIVLAQSKDFDTKDTIKMVMSHNRVYNNRNKIPYVNFNYDTTACYDGTDCSSPMNCYGLECQPYIVDGSGVYITRNNSGDGGAPYQYGWFYLANNISYNNGINGLVVHKTDKAIVTNNLAFMNGTVNSDPVSIGGEGRQNAAGITINGSTNVFLYNNISWVGDDNDYGYQLYNAGTYTASNNILIGGKSALNSGEYIYIDPNVTIPVVMFADTAARDFHLTDGSIAINGGVSHAYLPQDDFDGFIRDGSPDIGPYEYCQVLSLPFTENFTGLPAGEIPDFWSRTHGNWAVVNSNNAGGEAPEVRFNWSSGSTGIFRLVTPKLDATYESAIDLSFMHSVDDWSGDYTLKVQTSIDGKNWVDQWEFNISKSESSKKISRETASKNNIPETKVNVNLNDLAGEKFYIAFVFEGKTEGNTEENTYNNNQWYIDDVDVVGVDHVDIYTLTLHASPSDGGSPIGSGNYEQGHEVFIEANSSEGFKFTNWTDAGGNLLSDEAIFNYTMPSENVTLTAFFESFYVVTFTVKKHDETPVEGAEIIIMAGETGADTLATDANGKAETELSAGEYGYSITADEYEDDSASFTVIDYDKNITITLLHVGLLDAQTLSGNVKVYPNPSDGLFHIEYSGNAETTLTLEVMNITGKMVYLMEFHGVSILRETIDLKHISKGVYLLRVKENDKINTIKMVFIGEGLK